MSRLDILVESHETGWWGLRMGMGILLLVDMSNWATSGVQVLGQIMEPKLNREIKHIDSLRF
jgi:hypothetical protein